MSGWDEVALVDLGRFSSGKPIVPGSEGQFKAFGSNGVIGGSPVARHDRGIIVGRVGAYCGSVAVSHDPFWASDNTIVIEPVVDEDLDYLYYLLRSANLNRHAGGAAQPLVTQGTLKALLFPVPGPASRRQIGRLLRNFDDLIEKNRRRVAVLEEIARAIYREWFVKFRYPGHEDVPLIDSTLGPIPVGWRAGTVGEVLELKYGKALKADARRGGDVTVVSSAGVVGWHDESLVDGPAIVVGRKGNVGSVHWVDGHCWPIDTAYYVATNLPLRFVAEQLRRIEFTNTHAAVPGLSRESAYARPFLAPPEDLLDSYQALVDPLGAEASALTRQSDRLVSLRDLLLPKLVTGRIDVSALDLDELVEERVAS